MLPAENVRPADLTCPPVSVATYHSGTRTVPRTVTVKLSEAEAQLLRLLAARARAFDLSDRIAASLGANDRRKRGMEVAA